jgi:hypothetical protein
MLAAEVIKQAKEALAVEAGREGRTDYMGRKLDGDAAWDEMEWSREEAISAVIAKMVKP